MSDHTTLSESDRDLVASFIEGEEEEGIPDIQYGSGPADAEHLLGLAEGEFQGLAYELQEERAASLEDSYLPGLGG